LGETQYVLRVVPTGTDGATNNVRNFVKRGLARKHCMVGTAHEGHRVQTACCNTIFRDADDFLQAVSALLSHGKLLQHRSALGGSDTITHPPTSRTCIRD